MQEGVDGRDKPGQDESSVIRSGRRQRQLSFGWRKGPVERRQLVLAQAQIERSEILAHMGLARRFRNGDDVVLPNEPGERDLRRARLEFLRDALEIARAQK